MMIIYVHFAPVVITENQQNIAMLIVNLILLIIAYLLMSLVSVLSFIYTTIRMVWRRDWAGLSLYYYEVALAIDKAGNIIGQWTFNDWWVKPDGYRFGNHNETVSRVLAENQHMNRWYKFGRIIGWILNTIDRNHLDKSLKTKGKGINNPIKK